MTTRAHVIRPSVKKASKPVLGLLMVVAATAAPSASRADLFWDIVPNNGAVAGGVGTWDLAAPNWAIDSTGAANTLWDNVSPTVAVFGAPGGAVTLNNAGATLNAAGLTFNATGYTLAGATTADTLTFVPAGTSAPLTANSAATVGAILAGAGGFEKLGTATLTLTGASAAYTGGITVTAGVLAVSTSSSALGQSTATGGGSITVAAGAALQPGGSITLAKAVTLNGTGVANAGALRKTGANTTTWSGAVTLGSATRVNADAGTLAVSGAVALGANNLTVGGAGATTISGVITGGGTLAHDSAGVLTVSGGNAATFTGPISITGGGVLAYPNQTSLGTGATSGVITLDNGTLRNTLSSGNAGTFSPTARNIVLGAGGGTIEWAGTATATDLIIVQTGTVFSGTGGLTKTGAGIISVVTPATYTGPTRVSAGVLRVRTNPNVFPVTTALTVDAAGRFDLSSLAQTVGSLDGSGAVALGSATLTVGDAASTLFDGVVSGTGKLTKVGSGALTLAGVNTYTGATTVSAGALLVNGSVTSAVTVDAGATLGGGGTVTGALTANGTLAPGNSPGVLTITGNATLSGTARYVAELGGGAPGTTAGSYDQTNVGGVLALGGSALQAGLVNGYVPGSADAFFILTQADASAAPGQFAGLAEGATVSLGGGFAGQVTYLANWTGAQAGSTLVGGNDVAIYNVAAVPEPATAGLLGLAAVGLIARRGRGRRRAV